mmetsp:Transcript_4244/g.12135  ORF Transcript_4244/g.12135 Transcript_4244/m.12135 type:complete len:214 (-) Transcript_4244:2363-3004(-)
MLPLPNLLVLPTPHAALGLLHASLAALLFSFVLFPLSFGCEQRVPHHLAILLDLPLLLLAACPLLHRRIGVQELLRRFATVFHKPQQVLGELGLRFHVDRHVLMIALGRLGGVLNFVGGFHDHSVDWFDDVFDVREHDRRVIGKECSKALEDCQSLFLHLQFCHHGKSSHQVLHGIHLFGFFVTVIGIVVIAIIIIIIIIVSAFVFDLFDRRY